MLILYKFSLFNINRSYTVRNYGVAAIFLMLVRYDFRV